jgi:cytochrome c biogenesis protein CcmG/thiol:disulfide interchange protein DsbE
MRFGYLLFSIAVFAIGFIPFVTGCRDDKPAVTNQSGAVDFRLDTLGHDRFYLNQYRGKVVVLAFWSTWCTICKSELVEMKSFAKQPQYKNLFVGAVCNDPENIDDVRAIVKSLDLNYPVLLDKKSMVFNQLKMSAVPTTIIIDQNGKVSFVRAGYDSNIMQQIKTAIDSLLASEVTAK